MIDPVEALLVCIQYPRVIGMQFAFDDLIIELSAVDRVAIESALAANGGNLSRFRGHRVVDSPDNRSRIRVAGVDVFETHPAARYSIQVWRADENHRAAAAAP